MSWVQRALDIGVKLGAVDVPQLGNGGDRAAFGPVAAQIGHRPADLVDDLEAGGRIEHLVKVVVYITDVRHREAVYRTMGEYIRGVHPVSTGLVVQALARPDWLVEIDATAVIPE